MFSLCSYDRRGNLGSSPAGGLGHKLRCAREDYREIVRIDTCRYGAMLDVETLVCTQGFSLAAIGVAHDVPRLRVMCG
jgi:hypothetical protein